LKKRKIGKKTKPSRPKYIARNANDHFISNFGNFLKKSLWKIIKNIRKL